MHDGSYMPASPAPGEEKVAAQERLLGLYTVPPVSEMSS
jgi:hypothetical protein